MEMPPIDRLEIPRNSPRINALIGRKVLALTWYNSTVYRFAPPYEYMEHVHIRTQGDNPNYNAFGVPELLNTLEQRKYPVCTAQEPSDGDLASYVEWTTSRFEKELGEIE